MTDMTQEHIYRHSDGALVDLTKPPHKWTSTDIAQHMQTQDCDLLDDYHKTRG